nr:hypothetical protein [Vibrio coralliirubri]
MFPNHLYGVSGDGADHSDTRINKTSTQVFWVEILGGGWTVGSAPTFTYDWNKDQAEIPLNISVSKTTVLNGRPWKFGIEANYYLEKGLCCVIKFRDRANPFRLFLSQYDKFQAYLTQ